MRERPRFLEDDDTPQATPQPATEAAAPAPAAEPEAAFRPQLLEAEADAPSSIGAGWAPERIIMPAQPANSAWFALAGLTTLLVVWAVFSSISFILALGNLSLVLGILAGLGIAAGLALIAYAGVREWRGYKRLAQVDALRAALSEHAVTPLDRAKLAALSWLDKVLSLGTERSAIEAAIRAASSRPELRLILEARVDAPLRTRAGQIGTSAALQGASLIAISPHASWDAVIAGLRGLAVIRQVASLYGLRPGPVVTVVLMRKVAWTAAGTAGVDLLANSFTDQVLGSLPVIKHIAAALPGSSLAAMRLYRLAGMTAASCSPLQSS